MQWVGMVRNVMLGREGLSRDVLLKAITNAGGLEARSYLTTGNFSFVAPHEELDPVVERIESQIADVIGRSEMVAVRSVSWLRDFVAENGFRDFAGGDWEMEVAFLRHDAPPVDERRIGDSGRTVLVEVRSREILAARPRTGGARPHVNRLLEHAANSPATARGWSTLRRIATARQPS